MRRPRIRFWQKVLAALVIVGVAPIALVSAVSTNNTRNDLTALGVTNIRQRSTSTANAIDAYLASRILLRHYLDEAGSADEPFGFARNVR